MVFGFGFCLLFYGVGFGSVLGKTWVLVIDMNNITRPTTPIGCCVFA